MTSHLRSLRAVSVVAVVVAALGLAPATVSADTRLLSATPEDGATVEAGPIDVVGEFNEPLRRQSTLELVDESGGVVASGAIDNMTMRIGLDDIEPGDYEVEWRVFGLDGHPVTGSWSFTVAPTPTPTPTPTPSPTPTPTPSPSPSPSPTPTPEPSATPSPSPAASPTAASNDPGLLAPLAIAGLLVVAGIGGLIARSRRRA